MNTFENAKWIWYTDNAEADSYAEFRDKLTFNGGIAEGDKGKAFREIQALLDKGDTAAATSEMTRLQGDMTGFGAYQSFGNLYIQFDHKADKG